MPLFVNLASFLCYQQVQQLNSAATKAWTSAQATLESGLITQGTSLENQVAAASKRVDASIAMLRHL
jgi:hypothetical protein